MDLAGINFWQTDKRNKNAVVSNLWKLANLLPNRPLLAENMVECNFAWLSVELCHNFPFKIGWKTNFGEVFQDIPWYPVLLPIRECGSTLYVRLARTVPPTNTNFRLTFFTNPTSGGSLWRLSCIEHQIWSLPLLFWPLIHSGSQFLAPVKNRQFLQFIHNS